MSPSEIKGIVDELLSSKHVDQSAWLASAKNGRYILAGALAVCVAAALLYQYWLLGYDPKKAVVFPNAAQFATALFALVAVFFAYLQWVSTRLEASLDRFYDRLVIVNERYYRWPEAQRLTSHFWYGRGATEEEMTPEAFKAAMYVYLEFDNLEYMLFRYKLGYVESDLVTRAISTFLARCENDQFRKIATRLAGNQEGGYVAQTASAVTFLLQKAAAVQAAKRDGSAPANAA